MTDQDKIAKLNRAINPDGDSTALQNQDLLADLLLCAQEKILRRRYPFDETYDTVPERYESLQIQLAVYLFNKRGAEGQTTHNENGINRSYESGDIPDSMVRDVMPVVKVF